jgi:acyl dehydratase
MATYDAVNALPGGEPGPWGDPFPITYDKRDVLLYAVGIGIRNLRFVYEGHEAFAVFPTFPIRWGGVGAPVDTSKVPKSPGPLNIDAERYLEMVKPLPLEGTVTVQSRVIGIHPRGRGNAFVEFESTVKNNDGDLCVRMVNGSFRRGVKSLGDIEPFEGAGQTYSEKISVPERPAEVTVRAYILDNQAHIYRLSGDYNPLHIDPEAARFGGFNEPILHGLCTFGHCGQMLLEALCDSDPERFKKLKVRFSSPVFPKDTLEVRAWQDGPGRVLFEAGVEDRVVVSNAYFEFLH